MGAELGAREPTRFSGIKIEKKVPSEDRMSGEPSGRPLRLLWLGTYESDYTRTRTLIAGLRERGVEVIECHRPLWELTRHKAGGFFRGTPRRHRGEVPAGLGELAREQRRLGPVDAVVAGYPYQPDALPAWVFAKGRRVPLIADAMISLSDTLAGDRARVETPVARRSPRWTRSRSRAPTS